MKEVLVMITAICSVITLQVTGTAPVSDTNHEITTDSSNIVSSLVDKQKEIAIHPEKMSDYEMKDKIMIDDNKKNTATLMKKDNQTEKEMTVTATAYTAYCKGCSGITATGQNLRENPSQKVIAVDPKIIPLGSKVHVEGYGTAIAGDTGGAIKGNRIDVFIPSREDALEFGRKKINITIID